MLFLLLTTASLFAQTPSSPDDGIADATVVPRVDLVEAEEAPAFSTEQLRFLKPKRGRLPQNPNAQVDYTAYTLEWGEVKLGITGTHVGILPRIQVGTQPILDAMGLYNGQLKYNAANFGPVDLALSYQMYYLPLGDFRASFSGAGLQTSVRVSAPFSLHAGLMYGEMRMRGIPTAAPSVVQPLVDESILNDYVDELAEYGVDPFVSAEGLLLNASADIRFNRRDSLVFRAQLFPWGRVHADLGPNATPAATQILGLVLPGASGSSFDATTSNPLDAYVMTVSYQMSFQQFDIRMGGGHSPNALAWIMQGNDVSYRFGGRTRGEDRRRRRGWRHSRGDVGHTGDGQDNTSPDAHRPPHS